MRVAAACCMQHATGAAFLQPAASKLARREQALLQEKVNALNAEVHLLVLDLGVVDTHIVEALWRE